MYKNGKFRVEVRKLFYRIETLKTYMLSTYATTKATILKKKVKKIQNVIKKYLWAVRYEKNKEAMNEAARKIMSFMRMRKLRRAFLITRKKIKTVQANIRTFLLVKRVYK